MLSAEIAEMSGAAFTTLEISQVKDIVLDQSFAAVKSAMDALTLYEDNGTTPLDDDDQSERKLLRSHIYVFYNEFLDGTVAISGSRDGEDYSNLRDKDELRQRVRRMLKLPPIVPDTLDESYTNRRVSSTAKVTFVP